MKKQSLLKRTLALMMSLALILAMALPSLATTYDHVSNQIQDKNPSGTENYGIQSLDAIDFAQTGSLTIHKYDVTAMDYDKKDHSWNPNGEDLSKEDSGWKPTEDTNGDSVNDKAVFDDYAIQGVEFSYLRVADIALYNGPTSDTDNTRVIKQVYGFDDANLLTLLGLTVDSSYHDSDDTDDNKEDLKYIEGVSPKAKYYFTADQVSSAISTKLSDDDTGTKNALEEYMNTKGTPMTPTDAKGRTSASSLPLGLYLVVETKVPEDVHYTTAPFFVSLPMTDNDGDTWFYNVNVYPKNQTDYPTLTKTVADADYSELYYDAATSTPAIKYTDSGSTYGDSTTASEGDTLNMRIIARIPNITSDATKLTQFTFEDEQAPGLSYVESSVKIAIYDSLEKAQKNDINQAMTDGKWDAGTNFSVTVVDHKVDDEGENTIHKNTMKIEMTETGLGLINDNASTATGSSKFSGCYMVIYYNSEVDKDAHQADGIILGDKGNECPVTLTWSRSSTPTTYNDHIKSGVYVYTYGINLKKLFEGSNPPSSFNGVEFTLRNKTNEDTDSRFHEDYYVKAVGSSGVYNVEDSDGTTAESATRFTPHSTSGELYIYGLEGGTYELVEVNTANGYSLLRSPLTIVINEKKVTITDSLSDDRSTETKTEHNPKEELNTGYYDTAEKFFADLEENSVTFPESYKPNVVVTATATVDGQDASMKDYKLGVPPAGADQGSANANVHLEITNSPSFLLPQTGGTGMWLVTILGVLGVAGGVLLLKKNDKAEEK